VRATMHRGFIAYFEMMPEFIRRMRYSGTACQVCHALHNLVSNDAERDLLVIAKLLVTSCS